MILQINDIRKNFSSVTALDGVSLEAHSGRPFGLLGRNGAGKTTLIRIIMGVFPQDGGELLLDGAPLRRSELKCGYLPEERGLYRKTGVLDQLIYFGRLRSMSAAAARSAAMNWLERLELTEYAKAKAEALSKGNAQRVQLAAALINDPDLIILDEPFSGLDPVNAMQLREIVREQADAGRIILFSSHQMSSVESFCDDILILSHGKAVVSGRLSDIRAASPHDTVIVRGDECADILGAFGSVECADGKYILRLSDGADAQQVFRALSDSGRNISGFEITDPTLEDIFVAAAREGETEG